MYNCIEKILYSMFQILLIIHVFATFWFMNNSLTVKQDNYIYSDWVHT
jgi:hypothetical protein